MAYTTINKSTEHFNSVLYSGDDATTRNITGFGFQPDWIWNKARSAAYNHYLTDSVRGSPGKVIISNLNNAEDNDSGFQNSFKGFVSDGNTIGQVGGYEVNDSGVNYVQWGWKAEGTAPSKTYKVVVVSDGGSKFRFRNSTDTATFGSSAVTLDLQEGGTYTFDGSDSTNNSHPFVLGTSSGVDGSYSTGVTYKLDGVTKTYSQYTSGYSSATSRQLIITVAASAPTLYYNCSVHSGMGGQINTNSTFGSSNFDGSTQTLVSTNTTSGFSIVKWTGTGGATTLGHGLGAVPKFWIIKNLDQTEDWRIYHHSIGNTKKLELNNNEAAASDISYWNNTSPTSSVMTVGSSNANNGGSRNMIAYCFAEKTGFSKFGNFSGKPGEEFVYTGFKPAFVIVKRTSTTSDWYIFDNKRSPINRASIALDANTSDQDATYGSGLDLLSNGFVDKSFLADDGNELIYIAFGQSMVGSNNVPATAR